MNLAVEVMSSISHLTNSDLIRKTESLVREERRITTEVLQCLREVEARMLYAELGYSSLYEFCVKHLRYSEGSAHRRISAMRLLRDLPVSVQTQTEEKIKSGVVSITNLSLVQGFLKTEKREEGKVYSVPEKLVLLNQIEHQSKRETERKLATIQPKILPQSSERVLTDTLTELRFIADEVLMKKLERVRDVSAHRLLNNGKTQSLSELLNLLADEYLKQHDPVIKANRVVRKTTSPATKPCVELKNEVENLSLIRSRHIPAAIRHQVWNRDEGKCTYQIAGKTCESRFGLEIDHIKPFAMGGKHELSNLRLLCRIHNQWRIKKSRPHQ